MKVTDRKVARAERPHETGVVHKPWKNRLRVALVYPNFYQVGTANLGFQTVYRMLNDMPEVVCERAFLPNNGDRESAKGRRSSVDRTFNVPLTEESERPLGDFDIVAFSVSFENDYLNIISILDSAGIPLRSEDRNNLHPLVVAGGVACWLNPEPIAPFFDLIFIGEAEVLLPVFIHSYLKHGDQTDYSQTTAARLPGVYVPSLYNPVYDQNGVLSGRQLSGDAPEKVKRVISESLDTIATHTTVVSSCTVFDSRYLIEIGRGCARGCRFCSSGFISRPPRFRPVPALMEEIETGKAVSDRIGLVGTAVSDLPGLATLCRQAVEMDISLAFSSLRADALNSDFVSALVKSDVKTATIAPDAGSERMRRVINKGITEKDLLASTHTLVTAGIANLKLYFMIGLPTETDTDVDAIVSLTKRIKKTFLEASRPKGRMGNITISLNCFVPKAFTPFQWSGMDQVSRLKKKIMQVRKGIGKLPNVKLQSESPRRAYIQALLARGDRRISDIIVAAYRFDGDWQQALAKSDLNTDAVVYNQKKTTDLLPWDFIDAGVHHSFLAKEYEKALNSRSSPPCPLKACILCGACPSLKNA